MIGYEFVMVASDWSVGFPGSSVGKESACSAGDLGSIPGSGRSPREENGNPHQYGDLLCYLLFYIYVKLSIKGLNNK